MMRTYRLAQKGLAKTNPHTKNKGKEMVLTPEVASALDRTNTSGRKAVHMLSVFAASNSNTNVENQTISRSAIRLARMNNRENFAAEIRAKFDPMVPLILHWDGKIKEYLSGTVRKKIDRLTILVSGLGGM